MLVGGFEGLAGAGGRLEGEVAQVVGCAAEGLEDAARFELAGGGVRGEDELAGANVLDVEELVVSRRRRGSRWRYSCRAKTERHRVECPLMTGRRFATNGAAPGRGRRKQRRVKDRAKVRYGEILSAP